MTLRTNAAFLIGALLVTGAVGLLAQTPKKQATYSIWGKIAGLLPGDSVVVSVQIANSPTATTPADGSYVLSGLGTGRYDIHLSQSPYRFTPPSRVVTIANAEVNGVDFQAQRVLNQGSKKGSPQDFVKTFKYR
jgi:hypothetical protein